MFIKNAVTELSTEHDNIWDLTRIKQYVCKQIARGLTPTQ